MKASVSQAYRRGRDPARRAARVAGSRKKQSACHRETANRAPRWCARRSEAAGKRDGAMRGGELARHNGALKAGQEPALSNQAGGAPGFPTPPPQKTPLSTPPPPAPPPPPPLPAPP